jgi:hypothetical protein
MSDLRQKVLAESGKVLLHNKSKMTAVDDTCYGPDNKTHAMRLIEERSGMSIQEVIAEGTLRDVVQEIRQRYQVEIDFSTVRKWRIRLGLADGNE